ncbi:MAG: NUDIX domain-containing protein [Paenibacillaceae bacterium]
MSELEMFDIFDEDMIRVGTDSRANAHAQGLWHQTFHCRIVNHYTSGGPSLLFQLRHKDKDTYPNLLDTSCAGHLQSGETIEDGVRELREELGITIPFHELLPCGMVAEEDIISDQCIDREFNHIFIHECDKSLEQYDFQTSEISGLFYVNSREFQSLYRGDIDYIWAEGIVLDEVSQGVNPVRNQYHIHDFTPMSSKYAEVLFGKLESI